SASSIYPTLITSSLSSFISSSRSPPTYDIYTLSLHDALPILDLENRLLMHERGKGAKYTRGRGPFQVVYKEEFTSKGDALRREIEIKKMRRHEKIALISTNKKGVKHASTKKLSR